MAFDTEHIVNSGRDFVVMASDGLFDNLFDEDILTCLYLSIRPVMGYTDKFELLSPETAAKCIANKAYKKSKDKNYWSPFSIRA